MLSSAHGLAPVTRGTEAASLALAPQAVVLINGAAGGSITRFNCVTACSRKKCPAVAFVPNQVQIKSDETSRKTYTAII